MARGSAPGERRGGRQKGTPNKATEAREAAFQQAHEAAFGLLGPDEVAKLTPAQFKLRSLHALISARLFRDAHTVADTAIAYFDAKPLPVVPEVPPEAIEERARKLHELQKSMRETIGAAAPLDASPPAP